jgi:hypothetical protein
MKGLDGSRHGRLEKVQDQTGDRSQHGQRAQIEKGAQDKPRRQQGIRIAVSPGKRIVETDIRNGPTGGEEIGIPKSDIAEEAVTYEATHGEADMEIPDATMNVRQIWRPGREDA